MWFPDLGVATAIVTGEHVRAIGWLSTSHEFPKGDLPRHIVDRIESFCDLWGEGLSSLGWPIAMGPHTCEFCLDYHATGNCGAPAGDLLYVFPEMLHHYVCGHRYLPPPAFLEALMACPLPGTDDYHELATRFGEMRQSTLTEIEPATDFLG
jgi:hypothetical protein